MWGQLLSPRVEDCHHTQLRAQVPGVCRDFQEAVCRRAKQEVVQDFLIAQSHRPESARESEDHMEVADWQQFAAPLFQPPVSLPPLALWTVPIPARVVGDLSLAAGIARVDVSAQGGGAAALNRRHRLEGTKRQLTSARGSECRAVAPEDVGHLQGRWIRHRGLPGSTGVRNDDRVQGALNLEHVLARDSRVDQCARKAPVTEKLLDVTDTRTLLQQMGRERMPVMPSAA